MYKIALLSFFALLLFAAVSPLNGQDAELKAEEPALITSCGQSPGPNYLKVFMKRIKIDHIYDTEATAQTLIDLKEQDKGIKTLFIVTGASLKGMGAAGISIDDELDRTEALIAEAKKQGILIVGAHVEGMDRRAQGAAPGDNSDELSIDAVCPQSDILFVKKEGNADDRFSIISKAKDIPLILFEKNTEIGGELQKLFNKAAK